MDWALHDPGHGAYGSGRLRIGPRGDFATAPSLGPDFADLLAGQLADWLQLLAHRQPPHQALALVEAGPGEGSLAADLAAALASGWPELAARTELVLVEPNGGMAARQRQRLAGCPLPCRWASFAELAQAPLRGVLLAHEVLDALAVERIVWDGALWRRQHVALHGGEPAGPSLRLQPGEPLEPGAGEALQALGLLPPSPQRPPGWATELHPGLEPWLRQAAAALSVGALLVVDYALEAWRYYAPQRSNGTLMAYQAQQACADPLQDPGAADLTAHLCIDSLERAAAATGWQGLGGCRQGEALLALGLAQRLHGLQGDPGGLARLLPRREALLRLVDPHALGDFRWLAYGRGEALPPPRFLQEPGRPNG
ncbi:MAG: SAM-dependent methyltransferase [Cyanobium sp. M30B3]|nr:MAG: SAM-dependent methyltransferase [Cyanobium sp. M30B3]